jgi:acetylornithine deacetylase/succinyl-diaminopimelate desuccinylase-like protein
MTVSLMDELSRQTAVQAVFHSFAADIEKIVAQIIAIQQIAAPTFAERARGEYVAGRFTAVGLADVSMDEMGNVYGRLPGADSSLPPVILSAHLDTIFPLETDLTYRREGAILAGPGMADNSAAVAGLLVMAETLGQWAEPLPRDLWFVANVGEEGLGDLCGMKAVVARFGAAHAYLVLEGGNYGRVIHEGVGAHRLRIAAETPGGHSWSNFGQPSAIHILGGLIAAFDQLPIPDKPKTSYNVGSLSGGISINTIAPYAEMLLDMRSVDQGALVELRGRVQRLLESANGQEGVTVTAEVIGDRPAGRLAQEAPLVQLAAEALRQAGCQRVELCAGSTDANIPISLGYNAVCVGLATAGRVHHPAEYLDLTHLPQGLSQLFLLLLAV